jgi:ABC-type nitrate/sulfonate/bicarbonate transport system substrate-binding protein
MTVLQASGDLEKVALNIGFIPLTDCAPLVIAREKGLFEKHGLDVTLSKETSWANIRDKVAIGILDAAQMLAPMPLAMTLGLGAIQKPVITALSLGLNGNAITVSSRLYRRMQQAAPEHMHKRADNVKALKVVIEQNRQQNQPALTFAVVYPFSSHSYELRYWMASAGIDPDLDVKLVVVPPPQMPAHLELGDIDGYCVGEPWNTIAVKAGIGHTLITKYELWNNSPEKVLGVTEEWAEQYPNTHRALLSALLEACQWIDHPHNRIETSSMIARSIYVNAPEEIIRMSMSNLFQYSAERMAETVKDFYVFHRYAANFPWRSHAEWFLLQMMRWGQIQQPVDIHAIAERVYRPDIYAQAANVLGITVPACDRKIEGLSGNCAIEQGPDTGPGLFFDQKIFDPEKPGDYLEQFQINHLAAPIEELLPIAAAYQTSATHLS